MGCQTHTTLVDDQFFILSAKQQVPSLYALWVLVAPAKRGKGNKREKNCKTGDCEPANRHAAMTCTRGHKGTPKAGPMRGRLKRVSMGPARYRYYNLRRMRWTCKGHRSPERRTAGAPDRHIHAPAALVHPCTSLPKRRTVVSKRLSGRAGVIKPILAHLEKKAESTEFNPLPESSTRRA